MEEMIERFKRYSSFDTVSSETSGTHPSNPAIYDFAKMLKEELLTLGVKEVILTDKSYLYLKIDNKKEKTIGLIAHMDTSPACDGGCLNFKRIDNYDGKDVVLASGLTLKRSESIELDHCVGHDLLFTDGYHLLGGDDKAGVVIIIEFLKYYLKHADEFLYNLAICFTPDEEIGEGAMFFDKDLLNADIAYTLDGGPINYVNYENFNASAASVEFFGFSTHTGSAYKKMINAVEIATEFNELFSHNERPQTTKDMEGFIHLGELNGDVTYAKLNYILRDFDINGLKEKEESFKANVLKMEEKYKGLKVKLTLKDQYKNMKPMFLKDRTAIDLIEKCFKKLNEPLLYEAIRGGTDGATITYMGLPCPNLGTGDYNCHSKSEFVSITEMNRMVEIVKELFKTK